MNIKGRGAVPGQANWAICLGPFHKMAESVGPHDLVVNVLFFTLFPCKKAFCCK